MTSKSLSKKKDISSSLSFTGIAFTALLSLLVLNQGGYYADTACYAGIGATIIAILTWVINYRKQTILVIPPDSFLFIGIGISALIGSLLAGLNTLFILEGSPWFFAAAVAMVSAFMQKSERQATLDLLGWLGILSAMLGILMFAGIIPFEGSENAGRLQFTFQYANAAGIWYAVITILSFTSQNKHLQTLAFFPLVALFLTQSLGAILIFFIAVAMVLFNWRRTSKTKRMWSLLIQLICGILASAVQIALISSNLFASVVTILGFALAIVLEKYVHPSLEINNISTKRLIFNTFALCLLISIIGLCALVSTGRLPQALETFIERLLQTWDSIVLLQQNVLFGTGPDSWAYSYQNVQSIQYNALVIHNGYAQIALDSGLIGLALFIIMIIKGVKSLINPQSHRTLLLALMLALHFLIDFDIQFASLLALFILLIVPSSHKECGSMKAKRLATISLATISVLCITGCSLGLWSEFQRNLISEEAERYEWQQIVQQVESSELLANDPDVREVYLEGLFYLQDCAKVEETYKSWDNTTASETILTALALYQNNKPFDAETILLDKLFQQPKNIDFFTNAVSMMENYGVSNEAAKRYTEAAQIANQPAKGLGVFMRNQKTVPSHLQSR